MAVIGAAQVVVSMLQSFEVACSIPLAARHAVLSANCFIKWISSPIKCDKYEYGGCRAFKKEKGP